MSKIVVALPHRVKVHLRRMRRAARDAGLAMRYQIILLAAKARSSRSIAESLGCSRSWASRVIARYQEQGEAGLLDGREDNGRQKLDEWYLGQLCEVVSEQPTAYGYPRPTWTRELLVAVMGRLSGVRIHVTTMSRALKKIGARRGRPRPVVSCPWSKRAKKKRIGQIQELLSSLPADEVAVYEDEVDIHLNPKIGLDWMNRGQQKEVMTPGQNEKRYLAGAMDAQSGKLSIVEGKRKSSVLFIELVGALVEDYPMAKRIHVILDNYRIHSSKITQKALAKYEGRVVLHFLPPYCPNENKIERLWQDLHSGVTRNHMCATMTELMRNVRRFLRKRLVSPTSKIRKLAA